MAALVVDDVPSMDPWTVSGIEVRGRAEALRDADPPMPGPSREIIRITHCRPATAAGDGRVPPADVRFFQGEAPPRP